MSRNLHHFHRPRLGMLILAVLISGCMQVPPIEPFTYEKNYERPLPDGMMALEAIPMSEYPDFSLDRGDRPSLRKAIEKSLDYFRRTSSRGHFPYLDISHGRAVASLEEFLVDLDRASSAEQLDRIIREKYQVYRSIGFNSKGTVLFTGYYEPIFEGRLEPDARFRYPLYKLPPDLEKDREGRCLGRRTRSGSLVPYYTRGEIDRDGVLEGRGLEIAYLDNPIDTYTVSVQGSARLRLGGGRELRLGYAGNNGHPYQSVAKRLLKDGKITQKDLSLKGVRRYMEAHPNEIQDLYSVNERYIFFAQREGEAVGSLNVEVTPMRTIATDKEVFPRGCLAFVSTMLPSDGTARPHNAFVLDQDTGGAIRSAGRTDLFIGTGEDAEKVAGQVFNEGMLYYLFLKPGVEPVRRTPTDPSIFPTIDPR